MNRLREYRKKYHMTQAALARKIEVSQSEISKLEKHGDMPLSKTARRLAMFFGVKLSALFPDGTRMPNYWWRQGDPQVCECGCGYLFVPTRPWHKFKDSTHRRRSWQRVRRGTSDPRVQEPIICSWCGYPAGAEVEVERIEVKGHAMTLGHAKCRQEQHDTEAFA